jgi:hypothetical protein
MEDALPFLFQLLIMVVFGAICAAIARSRGRTPVGRFFVGAIAPCIGLILVLALPDLKKQAEHDRKLREENRRLRERVKKDRMVADRRHAEVAGRITTHDRALGLDTSIRREALEGEAPVPPPLPGGELGLAARDWFVAVGNARQGPLDWKGLRALWQNGKVTAQSLVWYEGLGDWMTIADVEGLREELRG